MENMQSFEKILQWLTSSGGAVIVVSWLLSWLLDDWQWWCNLAGKWKKLIILALSVLVGIASQALIIYPQLIQTLKPYLDTIVFIVTAWLATQFAHKVDVLTARRRYFYDRPR